jgi:hypothetical protein
MAWQTSNRLAAGHQMPAILALQQFYDAMQKHAVRNAVIGVLSRDERAYVAGAGRSSGRRFGKAPTMVATRFGDVSTRQSQGRTVLRRVVGRMISIPDGPSRRTVHANRLDCDNARLALFGFGRKSIDFAGRGQFPL